jgi:PII-like signaling protein
VNSFCEEEKINKLLASLETMIGGCMIAVSDVTVVKYEFG